jgi:hypothetical protein
LWPSSASSAPGLAEQPPGSSPVGYDLVFAEDAMAALTAAEHEASVRLDFPRLGSVSRAADVHLAAPLG